MENGLLDRVEGNANVHRWSEQTQLEKGDSIAMGYVSEMSDYTRISVTQNNLQELKEIWDRWGKKTKQLFYDTYGDLPYLLDVQVEEHLFRALAQFWNPAYSCFTFGEVDLVPTVEDYTALLHCPRFQNDRIYSRAACVPNFWKKLMIITGMSKQALGYVDEATTDLFHRLGKKVTSVPIILGETFRSLGACRRAGAGSFDWVPLVGIWGAIGYAPLLVLRQRGLRQFVPVTQGLAQSEFVYRGAGYKRKVSEVSSAWKKTCRLKGVAISPATTPEYVEWRGRRVNDNIPKPSVEGTRPIEEYLQVRFSELEIMKQEFERKNLEFEKMIAKLEEEKMYLSLDVEVQKMKVEKERKEKRKIEEDRDDLKEHYKREQLLRITDKGKAPMAITEEENEGPPLGFTLPHVPLQTEAPLRRSSVTEEMVKRGMLTSRKGSEGIKNHCEFHGEVGHMIQNCEEFKPMLQGLMVNKELQEVRCRYPKCLEPQGWPYLWLTHNVVASWVKPIMHCTTRPYHTGVSVGRGEKSVSIDPDRAVADDVQSNAPAPGKGTMQSDSLPATRFEVLPDLNSTNHSKTVP
ncbi:Nucleoside-triphosphatase THEP1 [Gossypium arboreum]|uniref:Nucleoside-triphosphatase THEP1 n=1 Tax=Gossypium arboreum TaxID=29729 RepID=A0A0B0P440_GOSAR|nr:Nucleoside-triphosphatase THEP1 [Gossypium arboreum]